MHADPDLAVVGAQRYLHHELAPARVRRAGRSGRRQRYVDEILAYLQRSLFGERPRSPDRGKIVVPLTTRNGPQLEIPFRLGSTAFVPDAVSLEPGRASDLCVFVRRAHAGSGDPLEVTGEIARPGEPPLPLRIEGAPRVVPDADGFDRYVVTVVPPPATPGAYALRLTFREAGTGRTARSETQIVLER